MNETSAISKEQLTKVAELTKKNKVVTLQVRAPNDAPMNIELDTDKQRITFIYHSTIPSAFFKRARQDFLGFFKPYENYIQSYDRRDSFELKKK